MRRGYQFARFGRANSRPGRRGKEPRSGVFPRSLLGRDRRVLTKVNDPVHGLTSPVSPSSGRRLFGIEGLRAIAAMGVLIAHCSDFLAGPAVTATVGYPLKLMSSGLTLFFVLSGFLLYRPFVVSLANRRSLPGLRRFLENRALRIFPAYWVVLLVCGLVLGVVNTRALDIGEEFASSTGYLTDGRLFITNLLLLQNYYPEGVKTGLGVSWSLGVEVAFYVVMPVACIYLVKLIGSRMSVAFAPVVLFLIVGTSSLVFLEHVLNSAGSEAEQMYLLWGQSWTAVLARSFVVWCSLFAFGMIAAVLFVAQSEGKIPKTLAGLQLTVLLLPVSLLIAAGLFRTAYRDLGLALFFGCLIVYAATPSANGSAVLASRMLELPPIRYLGELSYSIYLWHVPVIILGLKLRWLVPSSDSLSDYLKGFVIVVIVVVSLSSLTYHLVEKPALRLKRASVSKSGS
ncbi:acyltransferase [Gordonia sp. VNQ95]|uniref:acyltransferase family protein n=1 Tax=Gordonia sp. VNQ95 TaxID=3156619 RepID=UPI0032B57132